MEIVSKLKTTIFVSEIIFNQKSIIGGKLLKLSKPIEQMKQFWKYIALIRVITVFDKFMEEVICRINPANSDLFAGLIWQIVAYLPDYQGQEKRGGSHSRYVQFSILEMDSLTKNMTSGK